MSFEHRCLISKGKDETIHRKAEKHSLMKKSHDMVRYHHLRHTKCNALKLLKLHLKKNTFIYWLYVCARVDILGSWLCTCPDTCVAGRGWPVESFLLLPLLGDPPPPSLLVDSAAPLVCICPAQFSSSIWTIAASTCVTEHEAHFIFHFQAVSFLFLAN